MKNTLLDIVEAFKLWRFWLILSKFDIIKKYKRSFLGPWWISISTLILILSISFIYSGLFGLDFKKYILSLSLNLMIWFLIRDCIVESCNSLIESKNFLSNEKFNLIIFTLRVMIRNCMIFSHNILIFVVIFFIYSDFKIIFFLISLFSFLLLLIFLLPICISLSILGTRFRDVQMIITNLMQFLFFVSPILFTKTILLELEWIIIINPIALFLLSISEPINLGIVNIMYFQILFLYLFFANLILVIVYQKYKLNIKYWL